MGACDESSRSPWRAVELDKRTGTGRDGSRSSREIEFSPRLRIITSPYAGPGKKRREAPSADSSSVHYRRSWLHIRRETRPKPVPSIGSTNRMRHRIRVPTRLRLRLLLLLLPLLRLPSIPYARASVNTGLLHLHQATAGFFPAAGCSWKQPLPQVARGCG